jgi:hypothetical protein
LIGGGVAVVALLTRIVRDRGVTPIRYWLLLHGG